MDHSHPNQINHFISVLHLCHEVLFKITRFGTLETSKYVIVCQVAITHKIMVKRQIKHILAALGENVNIMLKFSLN